MITKIVSVVTRTYSDNGQTKLYVNWLDSRRGSGRTECDASGALSYPGMRALILRALRERAPFIEETW